MRATFRISPTIMLLAALYAAPVLADSPLGTLELDQRLSVTPAGAEQAMRVNASGYALASGDRVATASGSAVLALNGGGGIGLGTNSAARFERLGDGAISVSLDAGTLLYSIPEGRAGLAVNAGEYRVHVGDVGVTARQASRGADHYGVIQRLDDGTVRVAVRDGEATVFGGGDNFYVMTSGEQRGFRQRQAEALAVRSDVFDTVQVLIEIEAPEQVKTSEEFRIRWSTGLEVSPQDFITIAPVGSADDEFEAVASTSIGDVLEFEAPGSPGDYEIRYIDAETGEVRSFVYLEVVRDRVLAYWWRDPRFLGTLTLIGCAAVCFGDRDSQPDPPPVSP